MKHSLQPTKIYLPSQQNRIHTTPDNEEGSVKEAHLASTVAEEGILKKE